MKLQKRVAASWNDWVEVLAWICRLVFLCFPLEKAKLLLLNFCCLFSSASARLCSYRQSNPKQQSVLISQFVTVTCQKEELYCKHLQLASFLCRVAAASRTLKAAVCWGSGSFEWCLHTQKKTNGVCQVLWKLSLQELCLLTHLRHSPPCV